MTIFIILIFGICAENKLENVIDNTLGKIGNLIGDPEKVTTILEKAKVTKTSTIQEWRNGNGFENLNINTGYQSGVIKFTKINNLISVWLEDPTFENNLIRTIILEYTKESEFHDSNENYIAKHFTIKYANTQGDIVLFYMSFLPHPQKSDYTIYHRFFTKAHFAPAKNIIVVRNSKCNLLRCKTSDNIVRLDPSINEEHVNAVLRICFNILQETGIKTLPSP